MSGDHELQIDLRTAYYIRQTIVGNSERVNLLSFLLLPLLLLFLLLPLLLLSCNMKPIFQSSCMKTGPSVVSGQDVSSKNDYQNAIDD